LVAEAHHDRIPLCEGIELIVVTGDRLSQCSAEFLKLREITTTEPPGGSGIVGGEPSQDLRDVPPAVGTILKVLTIEHAANQFQRRRCLSIKRPPAVGENKAYPVSGVLAQRHEC
jgi:hypothetical protein